MKKVVTILLAVLTIGVTGAFKTQDDNSCDAAKLKNEVKPKLDPDFKYDSSKITRISTSSDNQVKEIEVPLFIGEKYRFVFNAKAAPKDVEIEIYNKPNGSSKRKLMYSSKKDKAVDGIFIYEPDKSKKMYINYNIPSTSSAQRGCLVFLLGYKI